MKYGSSWRWICLLVLFSFTKLSAQITDSLPEKLAARIEEYGIQRSPGTLFVHFDKNIYTPNENVWFTGYLLRHIDTLVEDHAMAVALIRNVDRSVLISKKFLLYDHLSFGNIFLPDSLPSGNYTFIAYTNTLVNGYPKHVFMQPVTIKSVDTKIVASLQLLDSVKTDTDSVRVLLNARTKDIRMIADAGVKYWLGDSMQYTVKGQLKTDRKGDAFMMIPVKKITAVNYILTAQIQYGKETRTMRLRLPLLKRRMSVKFYPESGNLVTGIKNNIGFEILNAEGEPVAAQAILYKDTKEIQKLQSDIYGMGKFTVDINKETTYRLRLVSGTDTTDHLLPPVLSSGSVISIANALAGDSLFTQVTNTYAGKLTMLLHNYKQLFSSVQINMLSFTTRNVIFDLTEVPRGLAEITVLDSNGAPLAERIFFAHYDRKLFLPITTDSLEYGKRCKVEVTLKLTAKNKEPVNGIVSVACVQDNRIDVRKMMDIESYLYLGSELTKLPFRKKPMEEDADNRQYLNKLLLIKGWRRYNWNSLSATMPDSQFKKSSIQFSGTVFTALPKKITKPMQVGLIKNTVTDIINTDSAGNFSLTTAQTITDTSRYLLFVIDKDQKLYRVNVPDPYLPFNKKIAADMGSVTEVVNTVESNTQILALKDDEFTHVLPTVLVRNTAKDVTTFYNGNCNDYVCQNHILNCPNHRYGFKPMNGEVYLMLTITGKGFWSSQRVIYRGICHEENPPGDRFFVLKGLTIGKEFYSSDYSKFNPPDPEYLSTIYWNHSMEIKNGEASISFYTGDITGRFRIIVQGTVKDDVIYADQTFTVKGN